MKKKNEKTKEFTYYSVKNQTPCTVRSKAVREVARQLDTSERVAHYEIGVEVDALQIPDRTGLRQSYLDLKWCSDFKIIYDKGKVGVCEVIEEYQLTKKAYLEQLEISRRYWANQHIQYWGVVIVTGGKEKW